MKETIPVFALLLMVVLLFLGCATTKEQPPKQAPSALYLAIAQQDSLMFAAFNAHSTSEIGKYFSEDLEFYHDKGGLSDYKQTMKNFDTLFENNKTTGMRRDLVAGSFEVYPIKDYGAVEVCSHRFCHLENGKDDCGTFKNVMVWQLTDGQWKVTRVISFDH